MHRTYRDLRHWLSDYYNQATVAYAVAAALFMAAVALLASA